jgi:dihydroxy-acid dehydratase
MGHVGMKYSLPSRELIADCVETMIEAHRFDAMICIPNCDKIVPGMFMGAMRVNIPTIFVSGGPMEAGRTAAGQTVDLIDAFVAGASGRAAPSAPRARGDRAGGLPDLRQLLGHVHGQQHELPGRGAGHGPAGQRHDPGHLGRPQGPLRARRAGIVAMARDFARRGPGHGLLPREIATLAAFDNAMVLGHGHGGQHQHAAAHPGHRRRGRGPLRDGRINALSHKTPNICKVSPSSRYHIEDVARAGGITAILGEIARGRPGLLDLSCPTVTGGTLGENIQGVRRPRPRRHAEARLLTRCGPGASGRRRPGPSRASPAAATSQAAGVALLEAEGEGVPEVTGPGGGGGPTTTGSTPST